jgi:hypothetical protein
LESHKRTVIIGLLLSEYINENKADSKRAREVIEKLLRHMIIQNRLFTIIKQALFRASTPLVLEEQAIEN